MIFNYANLCFLAPPVTQKSFLLSLYRGLSSVFLHFFLTALSHPRWEELKRETRRQVSLIKSTHDLIRHPWVKQKSQLSVPYLPAWHQLCHHDKSGSTFVSQIPLFTPSPQWFEQAETAHLMPSQKCGYISTPLGIYICDINRSMLKLICLCSWWDRKRRAGPAWPCF